MIEQSEAVMAFGPKASEMLLDWNIPLDNGEVLKPKRLLIKVLPEIMGYYVVHDEVFEQLEEPLRIERHAAWETKEKMKNGSLKPAENYRNKYR